MTAVNRERVWMRVLGLPFTRALFALLVIILIGAVFHADGAFFKWDTHRDMLRHISRYGILACGMTLVIITGGIDLAVGSVLGLVAVVSATLLIHWQWPPLVAVPVSAGGRFVRRGVRRAGGALAGAAVHRDARHDGVRAGPCQVRVGRAEDFARGADRRRFRVPGFAAGV